MDARRLIEQVVLKHSRTMAKEIHRAVVTVIASEARRVLGTVIGHELNGEEGKRYARTEDPDLAQYTRGGDGPRPPDREKRLAKDRARKKRARRAAKAAKTTKGRGGLSGRACPVKGCKQPGRGPRYRFLCKDHARFPARQVKSLLKAAKVARTRLADLKAGKPSTGAKKFDGDPAPL